MGKKYQIALICITILTQVCLFGSLLYCISSNEKSFNEEIRDVEKLFHGSYTTESGFDGWVNPPGGYNMCISLAAENIGYDKKNLQFSDGEKFNSYYIKASGDVSFNKETGQEETTWYLCDYDGVNSVVLLDENNDEAGRITYVPKEANWLGKRGVDYYWLHDGEVTQIYKRSDMTYNAGQAYLESRYYTGAFK